MRTVFRAPGRYGERRQGYRSHGNGEATGPESPPDAEGNDAYNKRRSCELGHPEIEASRWVMTHCDDRATDNGEHGVWVIA